MNTLVSKDESLQNSMVYVGYLILRRLEHAKEGRLSLMEVSIHLAEAGIRKSRPLIFALIFLYSIGAIGFQAPYIYRLVP